MNEWKNEWISEWMKEYIYLKEQCNFYKWENMIKIVFIKGFVMLNVYYFMSVVVHTLNIFLIKYTAIMAEKIKYKCL